MWTLNYFTSGKKWTGTCAVLGRHQQQSPAQKSCRSQSVLWRAETIHSHVLTRTPSPELLKNLTNINKYLFHRLWQRKVFALLLLRWGPEAWSLNDLTRKKVCNESQEISLKALNPNLGDYSINSFYVCLKASHGTQIYEHCDPKRELQRLTTTSS